MHRFMQYSKNEAGQKATQELKATHTHTHKVATDSSHLLTSCPELLGASDQSYSLYGYNYTKRNCLFGSHRRKQVASQHRRSYKIKSSPIQTCAKGDTESACERFCFQQERSESTTCHRHLSNFFIATTCQNPVSYTNTRPASLVRQ